MMIANVPASAARRGRRAFPGAGERPEEELGNFGIAIPEVEGTIATGARYGRHISDGSVRVGMRRQ
jgi:hypothetical protein